MLTIHPGGSIPTGLLSYALLAVQVYTSQFGPGDAPPHTTGQGNGGKSLIGPSRKTADEAGVLARRKSVLSSAQQLPHPLPRDSQHTCYVCLAQPLLLQHQRLLSLGQPLRAGR